MKSSRKMGIIMFLFIFVAISPVMAAGNVIKLPPAQWQDTASLVRGYSSSVNQPVVIPTPTYTEKDNGKAFSLARNSVVKIQLKENPTTGFSWNITTSPGLQVLSTSFLPSSTGRFGAGGTRTWVIKGTGTGLQQFNGIYRQPWMPLTGSETTYTVTFNVR
jgi:inhibitor of cysteine peptidase